MNIRIPSWTTSNVKASLNDQVIPVTPAGMNFLCKKINIYSSML